MSVVSITVTLTAITMLCMETMPTFAELRCGRHVDPFFVGETLCTSWFTVEFLVRLASCPSKRSFITDFKNVVDLVSVVPYYVSLVFESGGGRSENGKFVTGCHGSVRGGGVETGTSLMYLRTIRLVRVVRILKLTKHCLGLQVTYSLQATYSSSLSTASACR